MNDIDSWNIERSSALYGIENWGAGYFDINESGNISIRPRGVDGPQVDLLKLVQAARDRDIELPVLFRFNDILRHRVQTIYEAFKGAIEGEGYAGDYFPAYPIKVNQQRHVVDVLRSAGEEFSMGLEVGSKPELIAVLAIHDTPSALLLCNGYKDRDYVSLALMSKKVGRRPVIVIEKYSELLLTLEVAEELGIDPEIGFRLRLSGKGSGRWERSGGDRAKFGLTTTDIVRAVGELERRNALDSLRLLHFHIGSQLTSISSMREALKEATQTYVQLRKRCNKLEFLDVGGGLAVDYDGSRTNYASSMNYSVEEYARDVIWTISEICDATNTVHPNIVTEAGRATAAYHSILVFNVLGIANTFRAPCDPHEVLKQTNEVKVQTLAQLLMDLTPKNCQETLHDALSLRNDIRQCFNMGLMSLEDKALADQCFRALLNAICAAAAHLKYQPEDLERLPSLLSDTYFCNFSVFQSLPDHWAIDQVFPVCPIHRLEEEPTRPIVIGDITCDSDGTIGSFADLKDVKKYLMAHDLKPNEPYYLASFLVGAYQEILGDLHNLFGDTNAVHVEVTPDGRFEFSNIVLGDNIREVLKYVQYKKEELCDKWRGAVELAVNRGMVSPTDSAKLYRTYAEAFESYTYLVGDEHGQ